MVDERRRGRSDQGDDTIYLGRRAGTLNTVPALSTQAGRRWYVGRYFGRGT